MALSNLFTPMCLCDQSVYLAPSKGLLCSAAGKITVGLASHWLVVHPPMGSWPKEDRWVLHPCPWGYAILYVFPSWCVCSYVCDLCRLLPVLRQTIYMYWYDGHCRIVTADVLCVWCHSNITKRNISHIELLHLDCCATYTFVKWQDMTVKRIYFDFSVEFKNWFVPGLQTY